MKKKTRGFGLGGKNGGERKRDEPRKEKVLPVRSNWGSKKKKIISPIRSNWGTKKAKAKETAEGSPGRYQPSYEVREIEIADIKIGEKRRSLNAEKLSELMESISVLGLRQPTTVRVIKLRRDWGNAKRQYELVSGLHRLEAKRRLGDTTIPAILMEGDERVARMWELSENLHRAELTALEHDEKVAEWVKLLEADPRFSAQNAQKRRIGRPKGGISEAARRLPVKGKTHAARRRTVGRALIVDSILPEAKEAAKKAGFDKNRSNLLKIAAKKTLGAQLDKVQELTVSKSEAKAKRNALGTKHKADPKTPLSADDTESLEYLIEEWNEAHELKRAFIKASPNVRERFIAEIQRSPAND